MWATLVTSSVETTTTWAKTDNMAEPPKDRNDCNRQMVGTKAIPMESPSENPSRSIGFYATWRVTRVGLERPLGGRGR